jgi:hypothetical protein
MIARRQDVDPQRKELFGDGRRDPKSTGRIFRVSYGELDFLSRNDLLQVTSYQDSAGRRKDIANE